MNLDRETEKMNIKLPPLEWLKVVIAALIACIPPVACGAWYMSSIATSVSANSNDISEVSQTVKSLATEIQALVRHDERLKRLEQQLVSVSGQVTRMDDQVDKIQFEQANRTSNVAKISNIESEIKLIKSLIRNEDKN